MIDEQATVLFRAAVELYPDSTAVKVLADRFEELDMPATAALVRRSGIFLYRELSDGDGGVGGFGDGGGGGGYGGGYGYGGDGGVGGVGDGGGGGGGVGDGYGVLKMRNRYSEGIVVGNGFYIITVASGYAPYVLAGWVVRRDDLLRILNSRIVRRFGTGAQLAVLANKGPQADTELLDLSPEEWVPVASCGRVIPADPKKWKDQCPKPEEME